MSTVSAEVPVILLFLTGSYKEFDKKSCSSKTFGFSQTNYHLNEGFLHIFLGIFHPFRVQQLNKNNFYLRGQRLLSLKKVYFQRRNLFTKYVKKHENRLYIYKYNRKDLNELFPQRFLENFAIFRDHYAMTISQQALRKERSFSIFSIIYFVEIPTKTYISLVSTYLYPGMIKLQRKSHNLSQKSLFWTSKQSFAIRSFTAMFALWRSQNSLRKRKDHITGNSFIPTRSLTTIINSQIFRYVSKLNQTLIFRNKQYMLCKQRKF